MTTIAAAAAGAWLWDKFGEKIVAQAGKAGGESGRQLWGKVGWKAAAERYRGEMQRLYGTMRIIGMAEPVALADIFTDVYLFDKPSAWRRYSIEEMSRQSRLDEYAESREKRRNALNLVRRNERLHILGKPGAGKTTMLKHLVLECTTGKLDAVPIFIGLKAWADSGLGLISFVIRQFAICAFPDAQPFIEQILAEGQALVLFDGLDEVNLEQGLRERIIHEVGNLADQYPRSRYVITCRTAANDYQFERFTYCELADFTEDQMRTFVARWFQRDEPKHMAFLTEFVKPEHDRLRDLARTPLLLTLLCLAFEETMTFPPRRAEIYEEALDALLKKWDASRSIKRDTIYRTLSLGHKRQMLARIAAETFAKNELFIRQDGLTERIAAYVQRLPPTDANADIDGDAILHSIEAQHGLLVERAQRIYSFSHLTFHEYFTARYVVEHPSDSMFRSIVAHAHDVRWREVLLLTASMLDDTNAEIFFEIFASVLWEKIGNDLNLIEFVRWIMRKVECIPNDDWGLARQYYFSWALLDGLVHDYVSIGVLDYALAHTLERTLAQVLAYDQAHVLDQVLARANAGVQVNTKFRNVAATIANLLDQILDSEFNHEYVLMLVDEVDRALADAIDQAKTGAEGLDNAHLLTAILAQSLTKDRADALANAKALAHIRTDILGEARARARARTQALVIVRPHRKDLVSKFRAQMLTGSDDDYWRELHALLYARAESAQLKLSRPTYERIHSIWNEAVHNLTKSVDSEKDLQLGVALRQLSLPGEVASANEWVQFTKHLRSHLIAHRDIGHTWSFDEKQILHLIDYLTVSQRFLECLDLAAVADRDAIRNRLLLPPQS